MSFTDVLIERLRAAGLTVVDLRGRLPRNARPPALEWETRDVSALSAVAWHYDASPARPDAYDPVARYEAMARAHIARDWGGGWRAPTLAYHLKIDAWGTVYLINPPEAITWTTSEANPYVLSVNADCGEGQEPTRAQLVAMQRVADVLSYECPEIPAGRYDHYGHGELQASPTACPGALLPHVRRYRETGSMAEAPQPQPEPEPQPEEDDEMALTPDEREALELLRALGWGRGSVVDAIHRVGRAAEIGRALQPKRLAVASRQAWGREMAAWNPE